VGRDRAELLASNVHPRDALLVGISNLRRSAVMAAFIACALAIDDGRERSAFAEPAPRPPSPNAPDELHEAEQLHEEGKRLAHAADYAHAEPLYQRALAILEKKLGPDDPRVAEALNDLASLHHDKGDYSLAEPLYRRALAIREKARGPDHPDVSESLNDLAMLYDDEGDYARAEPLYQRALAINEKAFHSEGARIGESLNNLALLYKARGEYARAEPLYLRALALDEKALGPDHADVATDLVNLASLYKSMGDYARAEPLYKRALTIDEKSLGPDHPGVAIDLNQLASLYERKGDPAQAEALYQRALAIYEKALGPDHTHVATTLNNLGSLYQEKGESSRAEPLYRRALAIYEKRLGPEHTHVASSLNRLASIEVDRGNDAGAEPLFRRALAIREKALGPDHPAVVSSLKHLSRLSWADGHMPAAITYLTQALEARERHMTSVLATGSEEQRRLFLASSSRELDEAISLFAQGAPRDPAAQRLAFLSVLRRKGRVLDVMTDTLRTLRAHMSPADGELLEQLRGRRADIAARTTGHAKKKGPEAAWRAELAKLEAQADELERQIADRSAEFRAVVQPVAIESLALAIPDGAVLAEIVAYQPFVPHQGHDQPLPPPRYAVFTLRRTGEIGYADLGESAPLDALVGRFRVALADPASDPRPLARDLDERIGRPLRAISGGAKRVLLAPDGALNLVPFGALIDERGDFLVARYAFTYLTTGRDLLRLETRTAEPTTKPVIVANPDFGALPPARSSDRSADLRRAMFPPLPGTAEEGHAITALLPGATDLEGSAATKRAVAAVHSPSVLHIATHGFFLKGETTPSTQTSRALALAESTESGEASEPVDNPLLRSGIAFAGANLHGDSDDGVMTALEASSLDLWGTRLVVLSACETGIGEVRNGEGVYGLRRALALAGAESQVMSLWKVDDTATRDLMISFYTLLKNGGGRADALREAQLAMLGTNGRAHPYFWASFIPSGDWRSLDGKDVPLRSDVPARDLVRVKRNACGCMILGAPEADGSAWVAVVAPLLAMVCARRNRRRVIIATSPE
jgi:CHAT domain-containing protein/Tfp pilus assembly protein PilF